MTSLTRCLKELIMKDQDESDIEIQTMIYKQRNDKRLGSITMLKYDPERPRYQIMTVDRNDPNNFYSIQNCFKSPYIIGNIDVLFENNFKLIIAQEPYLNLLEQIKRSLSYRKKIEVLSCITEGLATISKKGYCHNAIWPISISITDETKNHMTAKINNFYYCSKADQPGKRILKNDRHQKIASNQYSSPEMRYSSWVTTASDVWSLGAIFYQLMFGKCSGIQVTQKQVTVEFPVDTPKWMMNLMEKMLAREPSHRYQIGHVASLLKAAIVSVNTGEKVYNEMKKDKFITKTV